MPSLDSIYPWNYVDCVALVESKPPNLDNSTITVILELSSDGVEKQLGAVRL